MPSLLLEVSTKPSSHPLHRRGAGRISIDRMILRASAKSDGSLRDPYRTVERLKTLFFAFLIPHRYSAKDRVEKVTNGLFFGRVSEVERLYPVNCI